MQSSAQGHHDTVVIVLPIQTMTYVRCLLVTRAALSARIRGHSNLLCSVHKPVMLPVGRLVLCGAYDRYGSKCTDDDMQSYISLYKHCHYHSFQLDMCDLHVGICDFILTMQPASHESTFLVVLYPACSTSCCPGKNLSNIAHGIAHAPLECSWISWLTCQCSFESGKLTSMCSSWSLHAVSFHQQNRSL